MAKGIAIGLLVASLVLLVIYGADAMVASSSSSLTDGGSEEGKRGFLPFDERIRGSAFGGGAVIMSIIGFVIARKEYAPIISALLFVNGALIIIGILVFASGSLISALSTSAMGAVLIGLGAWKVVTDRKIAGKKTSPQV
jgi:hypothetical protein